jgi:hypothetical protein
VYVAGSDTHSGEPERLSGKKGRDEIPDFKQLNETAGTVYFEEDRGPMLRGAYFCAGPRGLDAYDIEFHCKGKIFSSITAMLVVACADRSRATAIQLLPSKGQHISS